MLKKTLLSLSLVCVSFLTGYATAQSYFINKAPALPPQTVASNEAPEKNTLSPSDFQNQTEELEKKKNQALSNQLKQDLAKVPPTPPPEKTPVLAAPATPEGTAPQASQEAPPESTQPLNEAAPAKQALPPTTAPTASGPAPAAPPAASPPQSQVYTGFQNTDQNQNSSPENNANPPAASGGWNIKY